MGKYHNSLGSARIALKQLDAAIEHFAQAVELEPDNADFLANLATARLYSGDMAGAERDFIGAIALEPDHYQARQNLADMFSRQNRPSDAVPHLENAADTPVAVSRPCFIWPRPMRDSTGWPMPSRLWLTLANRIILGRWYYGPACCVGRGTRLEGWQFYGQQTAACVTA